VTGGQAATLGILQGLGEFLPISSSGHLIVVPWALGWPVQSLAFDVALHVGTLAAVLVAFARDWWNMFAAFLRGARRGQPFGEPGGKLLGLLALASIPGAVFGLLLDEWAETVFRAPGLVAVSMALMGFGLLFADRHGGGSARLPDVGLRDALVIGVSQALALVPGVSRSGATISAALLLGYRRDEAARFSFLLGTPIILGAAAVKLPDLLVEGGDMGVVAVGVLAAALSGFASIRLLLSWVSRHDYRPFAYYRFAFAIVTGLLVLARSATLS
jgi:undecaprenyl-diphosphatase